MLAYKDSTGVLVQNEVDVPGHMRFNLQRAAETESSKGSLPNPG